MVFHPYLLFRGRFPGGYPQTIEHLAFLKGKMFFAPLGECPVVVVS